MSSITEHTINNLKVKIKLWESEFFNINNKKPTKDDISNASADIKESYRNYWKLSMQIKQSSKANITKDDVWGDHLNKSEMKTTKLKPKNRSFENICNKIKQKSNLQSKEKISLLVEKNILPVQKNVCPPSPVKSKNISESSDNGLDSYQLEEIHSKSKYKTDDTAVAMKRFKTIQSVNFINSSLNLPSATKSLQFNQNINLDWLERCNNSIIKSQNDIDEKCNILQSDDDDKNYQLLDNSAICNTRVKRKAVQNQEINDEPKHYPFNSLIEEDSPIFKNSQNNNIVLSSSKFSTKKFSDMKNEIKHDEQTVKYKISDDKQPVKNETSDGKQPLTNEISDDERPVTNEISDNERPIKKKRLSNKGVALICDSSDSKKSFHLKRKIASGTLNENFIRLDIKKKKFSRGHRSVNTRKLKWKKWKQLKKSSGMDQNSVTGCFKCGQLGHWAKNCNSAGYSKSKNEETFEDEKEVVDMPLPTLEEAAKLLIQSNPKIQSNRDVFIPNDSCTNYPEGENILPGKIVEPLYKVNENGGLIDPPNTLYEALKKMGYSSFRSGQETAIMRVLSGLSTLVVLPTGSGKSLCYQLPAYMYATALKSFAIVVSPLVSLMEDQITGLPSCLQAVCLHSGMSDAQKTTALEAISEGKAQIVLVSPEAVISYGFIEKFQNANMPSISFVCIDEVHCLSQWSHNFRPSYLQLYKVLTQKLGVNCILGLTATATKSAIEDIMTHLNLCHIEDSVVGHTSVPPNLHLSISRDKDRDKALIKLLNGDRFHNCSSVIVYCIRRVETERLAALIRTCMQDQVGEDTQVKSKARSKKRNLLWTAEAYHAGLAPPRRRSIQKKFMTGKLRVVVATIAFGMGLDKPDVRAIIHYNMPKNFESYVQEIGRAGRDGLDSQCHMFLDNEHHDLWEQQRHIFSNGVDRHTLRKLLKKIFLPCKCNSSSLKLDKEVEQSDSNNTETIICPKHEIAFSINESVQELDVKQENLSTLLCYLELHPKKWIELLSPTYSSCSIRCYGGSQQMQNIASKTPSLSAAIALDDENGKKWKKCSQYSFDVINVASVIGCKSSILKRELKNLEWKDKKKTGVMVEFSDLAFHVLAPGSLSDDEKDFVLEFLYNKVFESEKSQLNSLRLLFSIFQKYSSSHYWECCDEVNIEYSEAIKNSINKYFDCHDTLLKELEDEKLINNNSEEIDLSYVRQLAKDIICTHHDQNFTGRAIARIFHGISSPCFPSEVWGKVHKFWRCLLPVDFSTIMKIANEELRNLR